MNVFNGFLQGRDQAARQTGGRSAEAANEAPDAMVAELLAELGRRFYHGRRPVHKWGQDQKALMMTLTWPAGWLKTRGVSLPVARYREILAEIIDGIASHGDLAKIEYFPSYLQHCVSQWFIHNGEELYERQKSVRNAMDLRFIKTGTAQAPSGPDPMEALAAAHRVLVGQKKAGKAPKKDDGQTSFF